uniref:phospholipase B1, membrane-associated isoform X3 n=1 Tax=Gasterosteus aculeatus aculeatus TaxID=481459 RepID=UPI001A986320|nr:phospholipase B1, membrane-associated isoform X3 [Gasterosteus aculeatus aculeatus]
MERLWIAVATCVLASASVKVSDGHFGNDPSLRANDWWGEYEEGIRHYSKEALSKEFPEKTRPASFNQPVFQCPDMSPSSSVPSSVEFVKAADIKVIAALGDSLTTAIGANATTVLGIPIEFRHVSWSIGGFGSYQHVITLANILKLFNPHLLGAAPGKTVHGMQAHISETGFNLAVTGHNTFNLPGQTRHLIDTLRGYQGLNFEKDWKLLTILMGMNDICDYCKDKALFSVDNFIHYITISLEMLMNEVPRMIVNVVQILPMQTLREVQKPTPGCLLQRSFCSCLIEPVARSPELQELVEVNREFQRRLELLLYSDRFFRDNFAVVLQPFLEHADPPRLPVNPPSPQTRVTTTTTTRRRFQGTNRGTRSWPRGCGTTWCVANDLSGTRCTSQEGEHLGGCHC